MNAYKVQVIDKNAYPVSVIDNLLVIASSAKAAIAKTEKHAKTLRWAPWQIREVYCLPETVVP